MSIFDDMYNWLARRNIGELMGLRWDPEKDKKYQRERLIRNAESWLYSMELAEKERAQGNVDQAGHLAYRALEQFPDANLDITNKVHARARSIIASLPSDFKPPAPMPQYVPPRMWAREAFSKLDQASKLVDAGKIQEAGVLVKEVLRSKLFHDGRADAVDAQLAAFALNERIWTIRKGQGANPKGNP